MTDTLIYGKQLTVSYSGLLLNMDMFPQVLPLAQLTHMWVHYQAMLGFMTLGQSNARCKLH